MHMQALPHREVAAVIQTVRESAAVSAAKLALEFLVLTAATRGEVRWADGRSEAGDGRNPVKRASIGEGGELGNLPLAGLIGGGDPGVDGGALSPLNPLARRSVTD